MFNKLYVQIKKILSENYKFLIGFIIAFVILNYQFPYYINTPGGLIDVSERVEIKGSSSPSGSLNMAYVSELKATIPTLIIAYFNKNWDIYKNETYIYENETMADANFRDKLMLKEATNTAIMVGFNKANKSCERIKEKVYVTYVSADADTNFKIGDEIIEIDGVIINSRDELDRIIQNKKVNDKLLVKVNNNGKSYDRDAILKEENGRLVIGLLITEDVTLKTDPEINLTFRNSESGPSGGLMTALSIYNYLINDDITKNRKIVGTGTIDLDGNVGSIGGVKYKIKGAMKHKADVFLVPTGENYIEALKVKEENNYDIEIVAVSTFDEALSYLINFS